MAVAIGLETAGHGQKAPGVRASVRKRVRAVEVGIGERPLRRGEAQMAAASASAYNYENDDSGNKERETVACPHNFYLARIERIRTSKCVPEALACRPLNRRCNTETAWKLRKAGGLPLTLVSAHSGLLAFLACVARCDARAGSFGHRLTSKVLLNSRPIYNRRLVDPHIFPGVFHP